jgi:hypothetical protein
MKKLSMILLIVLPFLAQLVVLPFVKSINFRNHKEDWNKCSREILQHYLSLFLSS